MEPPKSATLSKVSGVGVGEEEGPKCFMHLAIRDCVSPLVPALQYCTEANYHWPFFGAFASFFLLSGTMVLSPNFILPGPRIGIRCPRRVDLDAEFFRRTYATLHVSKVATT